MSRASGTGCQPVGITGILPVGLRITGILPVCGTGGSPVCLCAMGDSPMCITGILPVSATAASPCLREACASSGSGTQPLRIQSPRTLARVSAQTQTLRVPS